MVARTCSLSDCGCTCHPTDLKAAEINVCQKRMAFGDCFDAHKDERRLTVALDAFNKHEHLGKTEALRRALEAAGSVIGR